MRRLTLAAAATFALAAGFGDKASSQPGHSAAAPVTAPAAVQPAASKKPKGTKIVLRSSDFGKILFNSKKQAIYLFDKEKTKKAKCYGDCAKAWPPVYTKAKPRAGTGVDADLLGTTKRTDGRRQVTYDGHPLYYYAHEGPGQVLCHDVDEFGGLWLVVKANGKPVPSRR